MNMRYLIAVVQRVTNRLTKQPSTFSRKAHAKPSVAQLPSQSITEPKQRQHTAEQYQARQKAERKTNPPPPVAAVPLFNDETPYLGPEVHVLLLNQVPGLVLEQTVLARHPEKVIVALTPGALVGEEGH